MDEEHISTSRHTMMRRSSEPLPKIPPSLLNTVKEHDFFASIAEPILERICTSMRVHRCSVGDVIIQEGTLGSSLFFVVNGSVIVRADTSETILAELGRGAFFGEIGALYEVPRTATIISKTESTIAMLLREDLFRLLRDAPETLRIIAKEAQDRYKNVKPSPLPLGHRSEVHYQLATLRAIFPFCQQLSDNYLLNLILLGRFHCERDHTILSFAEDKSVIMILSGSVILKDPMLEQSHTFTAGKIATITDKNSYMAYLSSHDSSFYLKLDRETFLDLIASKKLPKLDIIEQDRLTNFSLINQVEDNLGGATPRRRSSVTNVFHHDQAMHRPFYTLTESHSPSEPRIENAEFGNHVALFSLLHEYGISLEYLNKIIRRVDCSEIDLSPISSNVTDIFLEQVLSIFGPELRKLNISGCAALSDEGIATIAIKAPGLHTIKMNDCINISSFALMELLRVLHKLKILHVANNPNLDSPCLKVLAGSKKLSELDISYCRNIGSQVWLAITSLASTLEKLTLHRIISIEQESIEQVQERIIFPKLRSLDLTDCAFLTTKDLRNILSTTPALQHLNLAFCTGLDETIAKALNQSQYEPTIMLDRLGSSKLLIESLDLSFCPRAVTDRSIKTIAKLFPSLKAISVKGARNISISTVKTLLSIPTLERVNISHCSGIDEKVAETAARAGNWTLLNFERLF